MDARAATCQDNIDEPELFDRTVYYDFEKGIDVDQDGYACGEGTATSKEATFTGTWY